MKSYSKCRTAGNVRLLQAVAITWMSWRLLDHIQSTIGLNPSRRCKGTTTEQFKSKPLNQRALCMPPNATLKHSAGSVRPREEAVNTSRRCWLAADACWPGTSLTVFGGPVCFLGWLAQNHLEVRYQGNETDLISWCCAYAVSQSDYDS